MLPTTSQPAPTLDATIAPAKKVGGLVLTRRVDQSIMIGDDVAIEVVEVRSSTARLRVIAPRSVSVHRREVYDAIQESPRAEADRAARVGADGAGKGRVGGSGGGLVLTRHADQSIMIGDDVEITVVGMKGGTVRLRVIAPRSVSVHRLEIYDAIHA